MKPSLFAAALILTAWPAAIHAQRSPAPPELTTSAEIKTALVGKWLTRGGEVWEFSANGEFKVATAVVQVEATGAKERKGTYVLADDLKLTVTQDGKATGYEIRARQDQFKIRGEDGQVQDFARYNHRNVAVLTLEELRLLDSALDQWAIEFNKKTGDLPTNENLRQYIKPNSRLHHALGQPGPVKDILGNQFGPLVVDTPPQLSPESFKTLSDVAPKEFWKPFFE